MYFNKPFSHGKNWRLIWCCSNKQHEIDLINSAYFTVITLRQGKQPCCYLAYYLPARTHKRGVKLSHCRNIEMHGERMKAILLKYYDNEHITDIVHPKMKISWKCAHLRLGWVYYFIKCVSAMDALQWMGAVRMRVQTDDKNIYLIYVHLDWFVK